jgi:hypothetical protein
MAPPAVEQQQQPPPQPMAESDAGFQWKEMFLPAGTRLRKKSAGRAARRKRRAAKTTAGTP